MSWRSLLDGELRSRALDVVSEIAGALASPDETNSGLEGTAGRACFLAYVGQALGDDQLLARGSATLDAAVGSLSDQPRAVGLWGGLADTRIIVAHLAAGDEADEALASIDGALVRAIDGAKGLGIDLIGGLAGIGIAALEGGATGHALARRVLDRLEERATKEASGTTWFTPPERLPAWQRKTCPDGYWNLGLAHGIPGVIGFLAAMVDAGIEVERAEGLLSGAVSWLLKAVPPSSPARYPSWLGPGAPTNPARLGWCYGDAGVTVALLAAARAVGDATWEAEARSMARGMAARSFSESGVLDMGICHGAGGVAHLFNRLFQATDDEVLGAAARRWIARLLEMRRAGEPVAGFPARSVGDDGTEFWTADEGILMGATGVGLVLLAAATDLEPLWDRALLANVAPAEAA